MIIFAVWGAVEVCLKKEPSCHPYVLAEGDYHWCDTSVTSISGFAGRLLPVAQAARVSGTGVAIFENSANACCLMMKIFVTHSHHRPSSETKLSTGLQPIIC